MSFLSDPANIDIVGGIITNHLVLVGAYTEAWGIAAVKSSPPGIVNVPTGFSGYNISMLLNKTGGLALSTGPGTPSSTIIQANIPAGGSIIQIIDTVLIPTVFQPLLIPPSSPADAVSRISDASDFYLAMQVRPEKWYEQMISYAH